MAIGIIVKFVLWRSFASGYRLPRQPSGKRARKLREELSTQDPVLAAAARHRLLRRNRRTATAHPGAVRRAFPGEPAAAGGPRPRGAGHHDQEPLPGLTGRPASTATPGRGTEVPRPSSLRRVQLILMRTPPWVPGKLLLSQYSLYSPATAVAGILKVRR